MKILAIIDLAPDAQVESLRSELPIELRGSWALYESGVVREAYATNTPTRVIFVLETEDIPRAREHLKSLPLVASGVLHVECLELRPFANWSLLFAH